MQHELEALAKQRVQQKERELAQVKQHLALKERALEATEKDVARLNAELHSEQEKAWREKQEAKLNLRQQLTSAQAKAASTTKALVEEKGARKESHDQHELAMTQLRAEMEELRIARQEEAKARADL